MFVAFVCFLLSLSLTSHTPDLYAVLVPSVVSMPGECVCGSVCPESSSKTPSSWTKGELPPRNHCRTKKLTSINCKRGT